MAGYLVNERSGCNLAHSYIAPAVLLLSYVLSATRWRADAIIAAARQPGRE